MHILSSIYLCTNRSVLLVKITQSVRVLAFINLFSASELSKLPGKIPHLLNHHSLILTKKHLNIFLFISDPCCPLSLSVQKYKVVKWNLSNFYPLKTIWFGPTTSNLNYLTMAKSSTCFLNLIPNGFLRNSIFEWPFNHLTLFCFHFPPQLGFCHAYLFYSFFSTQNHPTNQPTYKGFQSPEYPE